jgi:ubiquinone/menaquinone biosynthesis C-methylase UbiE
LDKKPPVIGGRKSERTLTVDNVGARRNSATKGNLLEQSNQTKFRYDLEALKPLQVFVLTFLALLLVTLVILPLLGLIFCRNAGAYAYILESLKHYPAQRGVAARMRELGLTKVQIVNFLGGAMSINYAEKPR